MEQHLLSSNRAVINSKSMKLDFSSKATVATNPYTYEQVLLKAAGVPEQEIEQVLNSSDAPLALQQSASRDDNPKQNGTVP